MPTLKLPLATESFTASIDTKDDRFVVSALNTSDCSSSSAVPNERECPARLAVVKELPQTRPFRNLKALPTVEQLGARVGDILRAHAGSAPCVLVGYSFRGKVAFEAAHALTAAGGKVAFVMLIDASASKLFYAGWRDVARGAVEVIGDSRKLSAALLTTGRVLWWALSRRAPYFSSGTSRVLLSSPVTGVVDRRMRDEKVGEEWVEDERAMMSVYPIISRTFNPRPLDARGVLIRTRRVGEETLPSQHLANCWGDLFAQGVEVIHVSGDHLSVVRDPTNRLEVARAITGTLDRSGMAISPQTRRQMPQFEVADP